MPTFIELVGSQFGRLRVVRRLEQRRGSSIVWECACACGNVTTVRGDHLRNKLTRSCGCLQSEIARDVLRATAVIHGAAARGRITITYRSWDSAKARCFRKSYPRYKDWGGRGITMCDRWRYSFENFLSDMGECPPGLTLDRINNDGNYEPGNCRWATHKEQNNNQRKRRAA